MTAAFQPSAFYSGAFQSTTPLLASTGTITLAGNAAGGAIMMPASTAAYPHTRNAAAIRATRWLGAATRVMALTGGTATFGSTLHAAVGGYGTPFKISARATRWLPAEAGVYPQIRFSAGLQKAMVESGRVAVRGYAANARVEMPADSGAYTVGGFANARSIGRPALSGGSIVYIGRDVSLPIEAPTGGAEFALDAFDADCFVTRIGYVGPIQVIQQKTGASLLAEKFLSAEAARYTSATNDGYLGREYSIGSCGAYQLSGNRADLRDRRTLNEHSGTYILVDRTALLVKGDIYDFSTAPTVMSVPKEDWVMRCA